MLSVGGPASYKYVLIGSTPVTTFPASTSWWGDPGDGLGITGSGTQANVTPFDLRMFSSLLLCWRGTFANAVTVQLGFAPTFDDTDGSALGSTSLAYTTSATNGGRCWVMLGANVNAGSNSGDSTYSGPHTLSAFRPPFAYLNTYISGATGTITNGKLWLYGIR